MKKLLVRLLLTVVVIVFAVIGTSAFATPHDIPYGEAVIDGKMDDCYVGGKEISTDVLVTGYTNYEGSRAKVWICWDYNGLNIFAEVDEKTPSVASSYDYERDGIEFFTDEDSSRSDVVDGNDTQYRVVMDGANNVSMSGKYGFKYKVIAEEPNDEGVTKYYVEAQLPWLEIVPYDGLIMGFDAAVNDANPEINKRDSVRQWSSNTRTNYRDTSQYGEIRLVFGENYKPWNRTSQLKVIVDGYRIDYGEGDLIIVDGYTLVPLRSIFEKLNAEVAWDDASKTVYALGDGKLIKLSVGSMSAYIDDREVAMDVAAIIHNGMTLVPLRFVADCFGAETIYDDYQGIIKILSNR